MVLEDEGADEEVETVTEDVDVEMDRQGNGVTTVARWIVLQELVGSPKGVQRELLVHGTTWKP